MVGSRGVLRSVALAAVALALVACEDAPPPRQFAEPSYAHLGTIKLDVGQVDVVWQYVLPFTAPNVEHQFPTTPGKAAERWARDRLQPAGQGGRAKFIIKEASVIETPLAKSGGLTGLLTTDQEFRYDAVLEVAIEARDGTGTREGSASARVTRIHTVREGLALNDLEQEWHLLTEALIKEMNAELEKNIRERMAPLLVF